MTDIEMKEEISPSTKEQQEVLNDEPCDHFYGKNTI